MKKKTKKRRGVEKTSLIAWLSWSVIGLALLPTLLILITATLKLITQIPLFSMQIGMLIMGMIVYFIFHWLVYKPTSLYVLAHELTHAIFAIFSGSRVKKIKVTAKGGYVEMSQSNLIIDLAPYFFPIFAIVWTALFLTGDRLWNWEDYYHVFFFGLGVLTAFHYACSWDVLKIEQPDMAMTGKIFGIIFVLLANLLIVNVIIVILFAGDVNLENIWINTYEAYYFWRKILFGQV